MITSWQSWAEVLSPDAVTALVSRLGYGFSEPGPLLLALTHRSWCSETGHAASNERLEFLGDAVLGLIVTDYLFTTHPEMPEGLLAKVRSAVVSEPTLAVVAAELGVGAALRLGKGEDASGGRMKASILSDALEAIIGAVYVDGGIDAARALVLRLFAAPIETAAEEPGDGDFKSQLQELTARRFASAPIYELGAEGPDHEKRFFARVLVDGNVIGEGDGRSKKVAEQAAAHAALNHLSTITVPNHESGQQHA
ncbi:MAG: ribonuclease III [Acidimicrobiales bacterium]